MSDDLLTTFRSEMPMPDEETTQRIYERATSGRREMVTRRRLVVAVAVFALAGIAAVLGVTLGGGGGNPTRLHGPGPRPGGGMALAPVTMDTHVSNGGLVDSIDLTLRSVHPDTTLEIKVVHSDASQPADADTGPSQVAFSEEVTPTVYNSTMQDATHASWSGTLNPSDWSGGCQNGLYRVEYVFGPETDSGTTDWFHCIGAVTGATGSSGPTGP